MDVIQAFRPRFFRQLGSRGMQTASDTETPPEVAMLERDPSRLQLYSALPGDDYIHKLAAEAATMRDSCDEAERHLDELEKLSLERLNTDYQTRLRFIGQGQH